MIIAEGLPFIKSYIGSLNAAIKQHAPEKQLSRLQCYWLSFVILGVLVTNTVCWHRFARFSVGGYQPSALCWMFKRAKIAWDFLLFASIVKLFEAYHIKKGILAIDDTDNERSNHTKRIAKVHKLRDKKHSGFFKGQELVFLLLVTKELTIPVGFEFYAPDPKVSSWRKEDKRLRKKGVSKKYRPCRPPKDSNDPTKRELALKLLRSFMRQFQDIKIKAVVADMLYDTKDFMEEASVITGQLQVISQIKKTQKILFNGQYVSVKDFFFQYQGRQTTLMLRHTEKAIRYCAAKFKVKSHHKKYNVIAVKYENESEYRYIIASDMTWLDTDVLKAYATRWLVEVFIQDWKSYEGWKNLAMQQGEVGSERSLTISLLSDHALHFHQEQTDLYQHNQPAATVGSLREKVMMESLTAFIKDIVSSDDPKRSFDAYADQISELFQLRTSLKHMRGTGVENLGGIA